jgi:Sec-independent protein translocase protein TatA
MKAGARVALSLGAGYFLGRTKKMRLALTIAAAGATSRAGTSPAKLLQSGLKQLASSPEVSKLAETARGELLNAAKAAAVTAASSRIDSISDRLQGQGTESLRSAGAGVGKGVGKVKEAAQSKVKEATQSEEEEEEKRPESGTDEDEAYDESQGAEDEEEPGEGGEEPRPHRAARSSRTTTRRRSAGESAEGDGVRATTRRTRATAGRSPVRRTGR